MFRVSPTRMLAPTAAVLARGTCTAWVHMKGYGFIEDVNNKRQYMVHHTDIKVAEGVDFVQLPVGYKVRYDIRDGKAVNVRDPRGGLLKIGKKHSSPKKKTNPEKDGSSPVKKAAKIPSFGAQVTDARILPHMNHVERFQQDLAEDLRGVYDVWKLDSVAKFQKTRTMEKHFKHISELWGPIISKTPQRVDESRVAALTAAHELVSKNTVATDALLNAPLGLAATPRSDVGADKTADSLNHFCRHVGEEIAIVSLDSNAPAVFHQVDEDTSIVDGSVPATMVLKHCPAGPKVKQVLLNLAKSSLFMEMNSKQASNKFVLVLMVHSDNQERVDEMMKELLADENKDFLDNLGNALPVKDIVVLRAAPLLGGKDIRAMARKIAKLEAAVASMGEHVKTI